MLKGLVGWYEIPSDDLSPGCGDDGLTLLERDLGKTKNENDQAPLEPGTQTDLGKDQGALSDLITPPPLAKGIVEHFVKFIRKRVSSKELPPVEKQFLEECASKDG